MESHDPDVLIVSDVLSELFPETDALDAKTITDIASGKDIKYAKDEYSASIDLSQLVDTLREWAPVVFGLLGAIKTVRDLSKPSESATRPSSDEVVKSYLSGQKDKNNIHNLKEAADATIARFYRQ